MPRDDNPDVFDLFSDGSYRPSDAPMPWYPGARLDLDDYARYVSRLLPRGRDNAVDGAELAGKLNLPWAQTEYPLRHLVRRLVTEKGWPIGITPNGRFYMIDNETDAEVYAQLLERRAESIRNLREDILNGWARRKRAKDEGREWPR